MRTVNAHRFVLVPRLFDVTGRKREMAEKAGGGYGREVIARPCKFI